MVTNGGLENFSAKPFGWNVNIDSHYGYLHYENLSVGTFSRNAVSGERLVSVENQNFVKVWCAVEKRDGMFAKFGDLSCTVLCNAIH